MVTFARKKIKCDETGKNYIIILKKKEGYQKGWSHRFGVQEFNSMLVGYNIIINEQKFETHCLGSTSFC